MLLRMKTRATGLESFFKIMGLFMDEPDIFAIILISPIFRVEWRTSMIFVTGEEFFNDVVQRRHIDILESPRTPGRPCTLLNHLDCGITENSSIPGKKFEKGIPVSTHETRAPHLLLLLTKLAFPIAVILTTKILECLLQPRRLHVVVIQTCVYYALLSLPDGGAGHNNIEYITVVSILPGKICTNRLVHEKVAHIIQPKTATKDSIVNGRLHLHKANFLCAFFSPVPFLVRRVVEDCGTEILRLH
mmetsp:Transcript_105502/g.191860  ORF Transcript_105502/g.191860 Transcript_105502/m.191860 type:complete len:246 (+) Transcript_105502:68-805(+)